jgi:hypothetical protein
MVAYKDLSTKFPDELGFLSSYFNCLGYALLGYSDKLEQLWVNEFLTNYLFRKIKFNLIDSFINETDDDTLSKNFNENMDIVVKYILRTFDNTYHLVQTFVDKSEGTSSKDYPIVITKFLIKILFRKLNPVFANKRLFGVVFDNKIFPRIIKLLISLNKQLYKVYSYDIFTEDLFLFDNNTIGPLYADNKIPQQVLNVILTQKEFNNNFIKDTVRPKITASTPVDDKIDNIATDEIIDLIKIIIKDNFNLLIIFKFDRVLFDQFVENNFMQILNSVFNIFRGLYNDEVMFFTNFRNIPRKKSLYNLDLLVRFFIYINAFFNQKLKFTADILTNKVAQFIQDLNKMITDYSSIITKDIKAVCLDEMISLFTFNKLVDLKEEALEKTFQNIRKNVKSFLADFDLLKLSMECENFILNNLLANLIDRIIEELEKSLKRNPKNSYFNVLSEKSCDVVSIFLNRYTINENTANAVRPRYKVL